MDIQKMTEQEKAMAVRRIRESIEKAKEIASEMQEDTIYSLLDSALEAIQWKTSPPPRSFHGFVAGYKVASAEGLTNQRLKGTPLHEALKEISNYLAGEEIEGFDEIIKASPEMLFGDPEKEGNCVICGLHLSDSNPYRICYGCQKELQQKEIERSGGRANLNKLFEHYKRQLLAR